MSAVITAESLGKRYRIGERQRYGALRDSIARALSAPFRRRGAQRVQEAGSIWALRGVTFEINQGDIVGIIGRNGSGKSTLLKILSRITEPTEGRATVRGTVGSLLEVGTGFHPELTGRENVFVNGAILGMRRREIERKFDEIVTFAQVERFIDTPVKFYSSGMQMRLAFAVAAHLQPDILLVDEVLAVGDAEFQRRCLGKMQDVSHEGRTVLLVSHQMGQIRRLCTRVIWLDRGHVRFSGRTGDGIAEYEKAILNAGIETSEGDCFGRWELGEGGHTLRNSQRPFEIHVELILNADVNGGHYGLSLIDERDALIAGWAFEPVSFPAGRHRLQVSIESLPIRPGTYRVAFALFDRGNNLTGGRMIGKAVGWPPLTLDVPPVGHPQDQWAGILNVPATLSTGESAGRLGEVTMSGIERA